MLNLRNRVESQAESLCTASNAEQEDSLLLMAGEQSTHVIAAEYPQSLLPAGHSIGHNVASLMCV